MLPVLQKYLRIPGTEWIPARHAMTALCFFGFFNLYALRVNMSVGIVAMVNNTQPAYAVVSNYTTAGLNYSSVTSAFSDECPYPVNPGATSPSGQGEFNWSNKVQGVIMGSFFYGYITTQLIGGWISSKLGAKQPFGLSIFLSAILSFFIPLAARYHYTAVIAIRVLQGITEGFSYPAMHALLGRWAPPMERSQMAAIAYSGVQVGTVVTLILSGVLAEHLGWESIFHFFGALGVIWYVIWFMFAASTPEEHPRISAAEKLYILDSIGTKGGNSPPVPWTKILRSLPVWTVCIGAFGHNWGFYTLLTNIPSYLSKVLHFSIQKNGFLSALPYIGTIIVMLIAGWCADTLRKRKILSTTYVRRSFHMTGQLLPSICLVILGWVGCDLYAAMALLILAVGLDGIASSGYQFNHVDISPTYAGILMGLSNTVSSVPGMLGPYVVGVITNGPGGNSVVQWRLVFYITAAVSMTAAIFFIFFASGELGDWETLKPTELDKKDQEKEILENENIELPIDGPGAEGAYGNVRHRAQSFQLTSSGTALSLA